LLEVLPVSDDRAFTDFTPVESSNLGGTWLVKEISVDEKIYISKKYKIVRVVDNFDGTGVANDCNGQFDISYDGSTVTVEGVQLANTDNSFLSGTASFQTVYIPAEYYLVDKHTDRQFMWKKLSNDNIAVGSFITTVFDETDNIAENIYAEIQCFTISKGDSLIYMGSTMSPVTLDLLSFENVEIKALHNGESVHFNYSLAWDIDWSDSDTLFVDITEDGELEKFDSNHPDFTVSMNDSSVLQGQFLSMINGSRYSASGCYRTVF
jgi:hypothetical protein